MSNTKVAYSVSISMRYDSSGNQYVWRLLLADETAVASGISGTESQAKTDATTAATAYAAAITYGTKTFPIQV